MIEEVKIIVSWMSEDDELNQYHLRIYWLTSFKAVVVASNITDLLGKKIADITSRIIYFVSNSFDLSINELMLVEHYPVSSLGEDLYLHVMWVNNEVMRYEICKDELRRLIGQPIRHE